MANTGGVQAGAGPLDEGRPGRLEPENCDELIALHKAGGIGSLVVDMARTTPSCLAKLIAAARDVSGLGLTGADRVFPIDFLSPFSSLKRLYIPYIQDVSLEAVASTLLILRGAWSPVFQIEACRKMTVLQLSGYAPTGGDLAGLSGLTELRSLALVRSAIRSMAGIPRSVEELTIHQANRLVDLDALRGLPDLRVFTIDRCRQVSDLSVLGTMPAIERISICGRDIQSVAFVTGAMRLKSFRLVDGRVLDGNVQPLARLDDVFFKDRPEYSHRLVDLRGTGNG